jgi:hypothetical protein
MPSVAIGQTIQFSAQVNGISNAAVTWSAGGVVGGNATAGTISPTGMYQAPTALPGQNPVMIVATTTDGTRIKASTYFYLLALGPAITSVSPNPLPAGTYTVTIQGSGFQAGAAVNNGGIQLTTMSVTSTTVKATGLQGPAERTAVVQANANAAERGDFGALCRRRSQPHRATGADAVHHDGAGRDEPYRCSIPSCIAGRRWRRVCRLRRVNIQHWLPGWRRTLLIVLR